MNPDSIALWLLNTFPGLNVISTYGETSFFYNPEGRLKRGIYFCTIKEKNGPNDKKSDLNRKNVYRFNIGISKASFIALFKAIPERPKKGSSIKKNSYNFKTLNLLTPHPIYGWMSWVSILNPSASSWAMLEQLLYESYELCKKKYALK